MPSRKSSRRSFLSGRSAADALVDLTQGTGDADAPLPRPPEGAAEAPVGASVEGAVEGSAGGAPREGYLVEVSRRAMACEFAMLFNAGQYADDTQTALEVLDLVERLEDQLSVYRDTSELSEVNRRAAEGPVRVEAGLFEMLALGMALYDESDGAFDLTAGCLSRAWGFFRRAGQVPTDAELAAAMETVGGRHVTLDAGSQTVAFDRAGVELNVNSLGKGYALDRGAALLAPAGLDDFLFHGGQSSVLARGAHGGRAGGGWTVRLRHPLYPERHLAGIRLRDAALATSGSAAQSFVHQGRRYGHLLDPRTGRPAEGVHSATVVAPSAVLADALATACYVQGPETALKWAGRRPGVGMLLVTPGAKGGTLVLHTAGLDDACWQLLDDRGVELRGV